MTKEEYYQAKKDRVEKMTLEHLQKEYLKLDERASEYFQAWSKAEKRIKELEMAIVNLSAPEGNGA